MPKARKKPRPSRRDPAALFTLVNFRAFVAKKRPSTKYDFGDLTRCPIAQFFKSKHFKDVAIGGSSAVVGGKTFYLEATADGKAINDACADTLQGSSTFGALRARLGSP
jgi:hypothetical protein